MICFCDLLFWFCVILVGIACLVVWFNVYLLFGFVTSSLRLLLLELVLLDLLVSDGFAVVICWLWVCDLFCF